MDGDAYRLAFRSSTGCSTTLLLRRFRQDLSASRTSPEGPQDRSSPQGQARAPDPSPVSHERPRQRVPRGTPGSCRDGWQYVRHRERDLEYPSGQEARGPVGRGQGDGCDVGWCV